MQLKTLSLLLLSIIQFGCSSKIIKQDKSKHVFYLHGRIIEEQGRNAFSPNFGKYEFDSIISAITVKNSIVHCEIRNENVDPRAYALHVSKKN